MPEQPDYKSLVGKTFKLKAAKPNSREASHRYQVIEFIPAIDFGADRKGLRPAFKVHRAFPVSVHNPPCDEFLAQYEEVTEVQETTEAETSR